jgi:hypothetical protein
MLNSLRAAGIVVIFRCAGVRRIVRLTAGTLVGWLTGSQGASRDRSGSLQFAVDRPPTRHGPCLVQSLPGSQRIGRYTQATTRLSPASVDTDIPTTNLKIPVPAFPA